MIIGSYTFVSINISFEGISTQETRKANAVLEETTRNIKTVAAFTSENYFMSRFRTIVCSLPSFIHMSRPEMPEIWSVNWLVRLDSVSVSRMDRPSSPIPSPSFSLLCSHTTIVKTSLSSCTILVVSIPILKQSTSVSRMWQCPKTVGPLYIHYTDKSVS